MLDEFREDEIARKVGGRFKLTAMIQKRMVALNRGARPLVDISTKDLMQIVVAEIMGNKIYLDTSGNVQPVQDESALVDKLDRLLADDGGPSLDDL
ncbi:MAG: DNA-directed RNA polymerase subunit omega [Planctomycetaceae bacterium]|nr:DNA-directed RNA polymerase subunit omega [Planctomycetaceae bacterium]